VHLCVRPDADHGRAERVPREGVARRRRDVGGAGVHGIAQMLPDGAKNTYDFVVSQGYGKPATRRLPYNEFGIILLEDVVAGPGQQTVQTASYGATRLGFDVGEFVHVNLGQADEEYVQVLAADQDVQTFDAVFTQNHSIGATVRPTIWPTAILNEGDSLAFDILAVASPDPGSDLTVVIQTDMAAEAIHIFDPRRNFQLQGFTGRGATTRSTTRPRLCVHLRIFQAAEDFAVLGFYNAFDYYNHLRLKHLPRTGSFRPDAGVRYRVRPRARGAMRLDAAKYPSVSWDSLTFECGVGRCGEHVRGPSARLCDGGQRRRDASRGQPRYRTARTTSTAGSIGCISTSATRATR